MKTETNSSSLANGSRKSPTGQGADGYDPAAMRAACRTQLPKAVVPYDEGNRMTAEQIKAIVAQAKASGAAVAPDTRAKIQKNGFDLANEAGVVCQWMDISPDIAEYWLKNNFRNRPLREDTVVAYARDMVNGAWIPTHQGIAFNDKDDLIDGQHRLHAIVRAKVTVRMMVTFGLPSQIEGHEMTTMDAVDRGATRSVADQLVIQHGFKNGSATAMICAALSSLCCGERTRRLSVGQTLEVYRAFEKAVDYVIEHKSRAKGLKTAGVLAGFVFAMITEEGFWEGNTRISQMFHQMNSGEGLIEGSPIAKLRSFFTSPEAQLFTPTLNRGLAELVLQAIYLEIKGEKCDQLTAVLDGANYFRSLQPDRVEKIANIFKLPAAKK